MPWKTPTIPPLATILPWRALADHGVVRNDDGSLMRTYAMRGPDLTGLSHASQGALMSSLNQTFQRVPGHWSLHSESQRVALTTYDRPVWPNPLFRVLDAQREQDLLGQPTFENRSFLTIRRAPLRAVVSRLGNLLMTRPATPLDTRGLPKDVGAFRDQCDHLAWLLRGVLAECRPLTSGELLTYLHSTVSHRWHPVGVPQVPIDLNWRLCDTPFVGGWESQLGPWHLGICSVLLYPERSMAPLLERLDHLNFGHRRMTRWIAHTRQASRGMFRKVENTWLGQEKGIQAHFLEGAGHQTRVLDSHATNQAQDADAARQEVSGSYVGYGHFTMTVMVWGATVAEAQSRIRSVAQVFEDEGFTVIIETEHSTMAWRSMIPGDVRSSIRRKPISSLNLAHLAPELKSAWPGPVRDEHLQAPPWFLAHVNGRTLLRVVNHVLDVGHTAVLGETGQGKSAFLDMTAWSWFRYPRARAARLDIGGSGRALTLCVGGTYDDLTSGTVAYQPLREVDDRREYDWALEWLLDQYTAVGIPRTTVTEGYTRAALDTMATVPASKRTLRELQFVMTAQSRVAQTGLARVSAGSEVGRMLKQERTYDVLTLHTEMRKAIEHLASNGILNGSTDSFADAWWHTIELGSLLDETRLARAILPYLMHRMRRSYTGDPMLLQIDEHALQLTLPQALDEAKRDLRSLRKANVSLMIATHSLVDVLTSELGPLLLGSCRTRFLLANPAAQEPKMAQIYEDLGCTPEEIRDIATMRPQGEYYLQQTYQNVPRRRKFTIHLTGALLACCGSSSPQDHALMDRLLGEGHAPGVEFAQAFLTAKGCLREAQQLREWTSATHDGRDARDGVSGGVVSA